MTTNSENEVKDIHEASSFKQRKSIMCPWEGCGRLFNAQFSLNRHIVVHTQPRRFVCRYCNKGFSLGQYYREHLYIHTKENPYVCGVSGCSMKFRQAGKLSIHRKTHPEYVPKKYNYSLNKEKRTKHKPCQVISPCKKPEEILIRENKEEVE